MSLSEAQNKRVDFVLEQLKKASGVFYQEDKDGQIQRLAYAVGLATGLLYSLKDSKDGP